MTAKEVLVNARALIEDPEHWCTATLAVDDIEAPVPPNSPRACKRCALGAISAAVNWPSYPSEDGPEAVEAVELLGAAAKPVVRYLLCSDNPQAAVYVLNDSIGHEATLAAFDRAIAAAS